MRRDRFGNTFAQLPQLFQLAQRLAHHTVQHPALLHAVLENLHGPFAGVFGKLLEFQQAVERALAVEGFGHPVLEHMGHGLVGKELKRGQINVLLKRVQHFHDFAETGRAQHQGGQVLGPAGQLHGGLHHEAQGAFGADEQVAEVVAGGVLDQALVEVQQFTPAGDHLEAGDPVPGHAVADHLDATGVGVDVAADLAGAGGGEVHRVEQLLAVGEFLQLLGDHPRLHRDRPVVLVEVEHPVHPVERHHQLAVGGHRPGGQAGAAPGGHQVQAVLIGDLHDLLHFFGGFRQHHGAGRRRPDLGPVHPVALGAVRIGEAALAKKRAELVQGGVGEGGHRQLQRSSSQLEHSTCARGLRNGSHPGRVMIPYAPI